MIYLDTETHLIARGRLAPPIVCGQWAQDAGPVEIVSGPALLPLAREWLRSETIVLANAAYDLACLCAADIELMPLVLDALEQGRIVDVLLDGKLLDIASGEYEFRSAKGWSLASLAARVGIALDKDPEAWRLRFAALDGIDPAYWPAGAREYAIGDVIATRAVHLAQCAAREAWLREGLDPLGFHSAHAVRAGFDLHLMSCRGVHTHRARTEALAVATEEYLDMLRKRLQRAGIVRKDGTRNLKAAARAMVRMCAKAGIPVALTEGGEKKAQALAGKDAPAEVLAAARAQVASALEGVALDKDAAILSGSRVMEVYSTFVGASLVRSRVERMRQGHDMPLQTRFDPLKETARTSSTTPQPPLVGEQMQNFPNADRTGRKFSSARLGGQLRECFTPRGCV